MSRRYEIVLPGLLRKHPGIVPESTRINTIIGRQEGRSRPNAQYRSKWQVHDRSVDDYSRALRLALPGGLGDILQRKITEGAEPAILDLMASDSVVNEAVSNGFGFGMAVSLGFPKAPHAPDSVENINGDLLDYSTWQEIRAKLRATGRSVFDVITSRAEGGLDHVTQFPIVHFRMLQEMWSLLSPDNGEMIFQAPVGSQRTGIEYFDLLREYYSIEISRQSIDTVPAFGYAVYMKKTPDSPRRLPTPRMLGIR